MGQVIDNYENIVRIANSEVPVGTDSPVLNLFEARKISCEMYLKSDSSSSYKKDYLDMIDYYNEQIKLYLRIW